MCADDDLTAFSIGAALIDTIDDLINEGFIEPQLAMKVLANFDRVISEVLAEKVKSRLTFKVSHRDQARISLDLGGCASRSTTKV